MAGRFSGKKKIYIFLLVLAGLMAFYGWIAWRDLHLDPDSIKKVVKEGPAIVVESLSMEKEVSGGIWHIHAERTERKSGLIAAEQITVTGKTSEGNRWRVVAPSGVFDEGSSDGVLYNPEGVTESETFTVSWEAPEAQWKSAKAEWIFPKGISADHTQGTLRGNYGRATEDGVFYVEKGAALTWRE